MDTFSSIRIKTEVVKDFRKFSKTVASTHSEALEVMMTFFIENRISPHQDCGPSFQKLEKNILKRINALIAIIKDIEKNQTKPTMAMLQALFENVEPKQKLMVEKSFEQLEKERLNKEFMARLKEKSEYDNKKDGKD
ncbi:BfmA/BtgA family mobilization protein [Winogradskyella bathintestinalis]|uniref:BfmA/BtgA family mobilization protein n=1 Tax=Winogradskyella bathintestinalis TaxID=3035208 RepID=A0ABT7ZWW5_9FLAO|nr:BfmA/BtgA family mobilization protein [Winogradskyella bathintestinalis]MDN3493502.1 BfmA/BtgA family mobilization protein [Winogradskyella bathintestinalis]